MNQLKLEIGKTDGKWKVYFDLNLKTRQVRNHDLYNNGLLLYLKGMGQDFEMIPTK